MLNSSSDSHQRHRLEESLTILFYSAAVLLSTVGNVTAIAVFSCGRQSRTELRGFLTSLAVADLLIGCFCLPFTLVNVYTKSWPLPSILCKLVCYFQLVAVTSSVFTNMVIGFDRFWVVTFPLNHRLTYNRSRLVICGLWFISLLLSSVQLLVSDKKRVNETDQCREHWESHRNQRIYSVFVLILTYLLPLGVLSITYTAIGRKLWNRTLPGNADLARDSQHIRAKRKIVKMLIVVVLLFALCWMPLHIFNVLSDYTQLSAWLPGVTLDRIFITFHWTAMANSFVNPMVYGFMNDTFKADLKDLARRIGCCNIGPTQGPQRHQQTNGNFNYNRARATTCREATNRAVNHRQEGAVAMPLLSLKKSVSNLETTGVGCRKQAADSVAQFVTQI